MEWLKTLSILLPILVVLSGAGIYLFNWYIEPSFDHAEYYTTAWLEYGVNQNTLNIEIELDMQGTSFYAAGEALRRVAAKAEVNSKIDGKPIIIIMYIRHKTALVRIGETVITAKQMEVMKYGTVEEKKQMLRILAQRAEVNEGLQTVFIERDGKLIEVPAGPDILASDLAVEAYIKNKFESEVVYA